MFVLIAMSAFKWIFRLNPGLNPAAAPGLNKGKINPEDQSWGSSLDQAKVQ